MIKSPNVNLSDINMFLDTQNINNNSFTVVIEVLWVKCRSDDVMWRRKKIIKIQRGKEEKMKRYETFVRMITIKITLNIWIIIRIVKLKGGLFLYSTSLHESGPFNLAPATPSSEGGVAVCDSYTKRVEEEGSVKWKLLHIQLKAHWGSFIFSFILLY